MTKTRRHRWNRPAGLVGLLLAALAAGCGQTEAKPGSPTGESSTPVPVGLVAAEERTLPQVLDVTGTLVADAETQVAAEVEQRVVSVLVERGQLVTEGQALVELDQTDARNQLREAEAMEAQTRARLGLPLGQAFDARRTPEVRQAQVAVERAEADHRRFQSLVEEGAVSRSEYDLRRADYLAAREQLATAENQVHQLYQTLQAQRARVAMARKLCEDSVIRAPFRGVVAEKHVNVGRFMKKGDPVATIVRVDPLRVELAVPEAAVAAVRRGQKVSFAVQTHPDRRFEGAVAYVGPAVRTDSRALVVEAIVPNHSGLLHPGLFATARIELPATRPSVMVPASAVSMDSGVARVFAAGAGVAEVRIVQIGRELGGEVEVLRGLRAGERVVRRPVEGLADGVRIAER
jgi:RND family efflux transporter MFP subunit